MSSGSGETRARIGVIGGSGLYELAQLDGAREFRTQTPFGEPSDAFVVGRLSGIDVAFLARHGRGHARLPSEIPYRANIWAFKQIGVERLISVSAVGSMRETIRPRDLVVVDQFIDRSSRRADSFFGDGVAAHVSLADPTCEIARGHLVAAARAQSAIRTHEHGVYLCMDGPAFSTRAESRLYRSWEVDVIGMTNATEARLCREAEICYATLALVTDFDCWHVDEEDVSVSTLLAHLRANAEFASTLLLHAVPALAQATRDCACATALDDALLTPIAAIDPPSRRRLEPILERRLALPP